jgi:ferredoxin
MSRIILRVDRVACDGRGLCAELLGELITLDDWGYPVLQSEAVPDDLLDAARAAARCCPRLALHLDRAPDRTGAVTPQRTDNSPSR